MPWCLSCSSETSKQKRKCPECGQGLVKGPGITEPIEYLDREWYAIRSLTDPEEAESLRDFLESKGFDVAIQNGKMGGKAKLNGTKGSSMIVLVPTDSATRAANLVRTHDWTETNSVESLVNEVYHEDDVYDDDILDDESDYLESTIGLDSYDDYDY